MKPTIFQVSGTKYNLMHFERRIAFQMNKNIFIPEKNMRAYPT